MKYTPACKAGALTNQLSGAAWKLGRCSLRLIFISANALGGLRHGVDSGFQHSESLDGRGPGGRSRPAGTLYVGPQEPSKHQRSAFPILATWGTCSLAYSATFGNSLQCPDNRRRRNCVARVSKRSSSRLRL